MAVPMDGSHFVLFRGDLEGIECWIVRVLSHGVYGWSESREHLSLRFVHISCLDYSCNVGLVSVSQCLPMAFIRGGRAVVGCLRQRNL